MAYENYDLITEVDKRLKYRKFKDFIISPENGSGSKYGNGIKRYILDSEYLSQPYTMKNFAVEVKTLNEVNNIVGSSSTKWYRVYMKSTGTFIVLYGIEIEELWINVEN